ncbi:hypothetical protein GQ600_9428 [Phytophthora cactorum]|nr:hypothetical protein GQ600_9428 [Phytophthora cactorum]
MNPIYYTVEEPSIYVKRWLVDRLLQLISPKREVTIAYLKECRPAAAYSKSLFETGVHEKLRRGCTIEVRGLGDSAEETYLNIEKSTGMRSFGSDFSAADLVSDKYHVPTKENFVSIDSFYYSTSPLNCCFSR